MRLFIALIFIPASLFGQYVSVTFKTAPYPTNIWDQCVYQSTTNTRQPQVLFTTEAFNAYMATNATSVAAWKTNSANPQVALNEKIAELVDIYQLIPTGRTICTNDMASSATIEASLASGTNTQAQVVTRIRQINANVNDALMLENRILELLQRLGPVLKSMYRPEDDTTP